MYCNFYGFKEKPFNITPNPGFIFLSKEHREAFAHLFYGIVNHSGFIELVGEVGTGKTTVLRALLNHLSDERYRSAFIFNPCLSAEELLRSINREYGLEADGLSIAKLHEVLNDFLLIQNAEGRTVVLVIDEAQKLDPEVLEQIRLVSNLETETDKLIQIVLAGQPELAELLDQPRLRQLAQRISVRYQLVPMDYNDTAAYIDHRLELAGGWRAAQFTPAALKKIYKFSGGLPRLINVACDRALLVGYTMESKTITPPMVKEAMAEIRRTSRSVSKPFIRFVKAAAALTVIAGTLVFALTHNWSMKDSASASPEAAQSGSKTEKGGELADALRSSQGILSEYSSAVEAFNAIAGSWQAALLKETGAITENNLEHLASKLGFELITFTGDMNRLLRFDTPALLQITIPGVKGYRYLALTGTKEGMIVIGPRLPSQVGTITPDALKPFWSGNAYIPWKNHLKIPPSMTPGTRSKDVFQLQKLLKKTGTYQGSLSRLYNEATINGIKKFQSENGVEADGKLSPETLLLLYRRAGVFIAPGLGEKGA